ncbi:MAG: DALR anticodon-binding domain-containing protein, partial [Nanoarchaeota archaeon]
DAILSETIQLAREEILKRSAVSKMELEKRALAIARAAILYGDLKNYRGHDMVFDIDRFVSFEGDTGPYLLYSYARAKSILRKKHGKQNKIGVIDALNLHERALVNALARFPDIVREAATEYAPNIVAQYAYTLAQMFNEFYHKEQVIGSDKEGFRLVLVKAFAQVLKNALYLLGITVLEEM